MTGEENVGSISFEVGIDTAGMLSGGKQVNRVLSEIEASLDASINQFKKMDTQVSATADAVRKSTSSFGGLQNAMRQGGYQIQDFIVQVQGGQSALVALSQQGSQLLGVFGSGGAVAGALLTIGTVIVGSLIAGMDNAAVSTKALTEAQKRLADIFQVSSNGVVVLSDKFAKLAEVSENAARAQLTMALIDAQNVIKSSVQSVNELGDALGTWKAPLSAAISQMDRLKAKGIDVKSALDELGGTYEGSIAGLNQLSQVVNGVGEANEQAALSIQKRKEAEQGQKFAKQEIAATQATIDPATGMAIDPVAQVNLQEQQKLEALAKYQELDKQNTALYEQAKIAIQADAAMQRRQISDEETEYQRRNMSNLLGATSDFFGEMAGAVGDYAGESSTAYKALFAVSKGFAIAQASMNLVTAISNAAALPWPANIPAIAFAAAQGASLLSQIRSANYGGGREHGGPVGAGSLYEVGEKNKPELLQMNGRNYMIPGNNGQVISNKDLSRGIPKASNGSGYLKSSDSSSNGSSANQESGNLTFMLNITNTNGSRVETSEPQYNNGYLTMEMFIGDMQQGGPMSRSITSTTSATRRATE